MHRELVYIYNQKSHFSHSLTRSKSVVFAGSPRMYKLVLLRKDYKMK